MSWRRGTILRVLGRLGAALLASAPIAAAAAEHTDPLWAVTVWGGWGTDGDNEDLPGVNSSFEETWFAGLGLAREFARTGEDFTWEVEAVVAKHFGWQRHWEGDLAVALRWDGYAWPKSLHSSVAIATGVSYASRLPVMEQAVDPDTRKWLQFMALEIDFARPERPDRALALRLHHRSAAWGLYGTQDGGSNFLALGFRKRF